jgi:hypothetical protein
MDESNEASVLARARKAFLILVALSLDLVLLLVVVPALWRQGSSRAFDLAALLILLALFGTAVAFLYRPSKKP